MNDGIRIDRSLLEDYAKDSAMLLFLVNMILMADRSGGSFYTSVRGLAKDLCLSERQVRTCMSKLEERHTIDTVSDTRATQVTICDNVYCKDVRHTNDTPSDTPATHQKKKAPLLPPDGSPCTPSLSPPLSPQKEKKEGDTDVSPKKRDKPVSGPSDFSFVLELWNSYAKRNVPKIKAITPARRDKVKLRIAEMGGIEKAKEILAECFKKISESDFATGATGKWAANFDWFFSNEKNWLKVLEGNYDNRKEKSQLEVLAENIAKADAYYEQRYHGYGGASPYGNQTGSRADGPDEQ